MTALLPAGGGGSAKPSAPAKTPGPSKTPGGSAKPPMPPKIPVPKVVPGGGGVHEVVATGGSAKAPKNYKLPKQSTGPAAPSGGGGLLFGAIPDPISLSSAVAHSVGHAISAGAKEAINLPVHVADGALRTVESLMPTHLGIGQSGNAVTPLNLLAQRTAQGDPIYQSVTQGTPTPIFAHPIQTGADLAGGLGVVDRVAGALARSGMLGSRAAAAADLTPINRVVTPSIRTPEGAASVASREDALTTAVHHISPGLVQGATQKYLLTKAPATYTKIANATTLARHPVQTVTEAIRNGGDSKEIAGVIRTAQQRDMLDRVDKVIAGRKGVAMNEQNHFVKTIHDAIPKSEAAANIAPQMMMGTPGDEERALAALQRDKAGYQQAVANHHTATNALNSLVHGQDVLSPELGAARDLMSPTAQRELDKAQMGHAHNPTTIVNSLKSHTMDPTQIANNAQHQAHIDAVLHGDENVLGEAHNLGATLGGLQQHVNQQLAENKILPESQMTRRELQQVAVKNDFAEIIPPKSLPSERMLQYRGANAEVKSAKAELDAARKQGAAATRRYLPEHTDAKNAQLKVLEHEKILRQQAGFMSGRYGEDTAGKVWPSNTKARLRYDALTKKDSAYRQALQDAEDAKSALATKKYEIKQQALSTVAAKKDALDDARGTRNALAPYQNERIGGTVVRDESHVSKANPNGYRPASNDELHQRREDAGVHNYAYMSGLNESPIRTNLTDRGISRGGYLGSRFKGLSVKRGTSETGLSGVVRSIMRGQRMVHNTKLTDEINDTFAHRPGGADVGTYHSWDYLPDKQELERRTGMTWEPVLERPRSFTDDQQTLLDQESDPNKASALQDKMTLENQRNPQPGEDGIVLQPKMVMDRLEQHIKASKPVPYLTASNRFARRAYLPFSPKFFGSITGEGLVRGALFGLNPKALRDYHAIHQLVKAENPDAAAKIEAWTGSGTHMGMHGREIHDQIAATQLGAKPSSALRAEADKLASRYGQATDGILQQARRIERLQSQTTVGRYYQNMAREMSGSVVTSLTDMHNYMNDIAHEVATNPDRVVDIAKNINTTLGKYNALSPRERWIVNNIAPFAPWYRNALEFMYYTLPHDHPLLTAALNDVGEQNQKNWAAQHAGLPVDMQDMLPIGGGGYLDPERATPAGIAPSIRDPMSMAADLVMPGATSAYDAEKGTNAFGTQLRDAQGQKLTAGERNRLALSNLVEGVLGGPAQIERAVEAGIGLKPSGDSTLTSIHAKHGTPPAGHFSWQAALTKLLDPAPVTHFGSGATGWNTGASGWSTGPGWSTSSGKGWNG